MMLLLSAKQEEVNHFSSFTTLKFVEGTTGGCRNSQKFIPCFLVRLTLEKELEFGPQLPGGQTEREI